MLIFGVDPGSQNVGYGIIEHHKGKVISVGCNTISVSPKLNLAQRLVVIYDELCSAIDLYKPDVAAIESIFYGKSIKSAFTLGHARGVCLLSLMKYNLKTYEYTPKQIKKAATGNGNATKTQVSFMMKKMFPTSGVQKAGFDATDALATAFCQFNRQRFGI